MTTPNASGLSRRTFVRRAAALAALHAAPRAVMGDPWDPYAPRGWRLDRAAPVRVRGVVRSGRRGLAGAAVSDGVSVATTDRDGRFSLVSAADRAWVWVSVPAGHHIPRGRSGTARFHKPLAPDARGEASAVFDLEPLRESDHRHTFLVLADPQTRDAEEMAWFHAQTVSDVRATVGALGGAEAFGVGCGDLMYDELALFPGYLRAVEAMGLPFFQAVGNHDLDKAATTNAGAKVTFATYFGPTYYSFDRGAVHYVVLDDVFWHGDGYTGYLTDTQLAWLAADLARVERGGTVVVFLHIPALSTRPRRLNAGGSVDNREVLYGLLEPYRAHLMSGHTHENEHVFEGGTHEHVHGAVCGAWWSGPLCRDGTPNGYAVYEARGDELRWRYKATGFAASHQLRAYAPSADPALPYHITANVWDWDPEWRVVWYEDGERRGEMTRRTAPDPLTVRLYNGPGLPARRPKMDAEPTDHVFYARASDGARELRVEATDRFGRVYSAVATAP